MRISRAELRTVCFRRSCCGLAAAACLAAAGCQPAVDRPLRTSLADTAGVAAGSPRRPTRPIPVVISPPTGFDLAAAERRLAARQPEFGAILPVAAERPAFAAEPAVPRRLANAPGQTAPGVAADVRAALASYAAAFNRHDPVSLAAHWTVAGENLDLETGSRTVGRQAVEEVFDRLFTVDRGAAIDFDIEAVRPIGDAVAVVDGVSEMSLSSRQPARSRFSAVLVRREGRWLIETVREAAAPSEPTVRDRLAALDWLRGSWEDISDGVTVSLQCDWADDGGFLIRRHLHTIETQPFGRAARATTGIPALLPPLAEKADPESAIERRTITEFIGWDDNRGEIRSWLFSSDGRTAEFSWLRTGSGWLLEDCASQTPVAAERTRLTLNQVGADELTLQLSSGRQPDLLPAADFVRTARPAAAVENRGRP